MKAKERNDSLELIWPVLPCYDSLMCAPGAHKTDNSSLYCLTPPLSLFCRLSPHRLALWPSLRGGMLSARIGLPYRLLFFSIFHRLCLCLCQCFRRGMNFGLHRGMQLCMRPLITLNIITKNKLCGNSNKCRQDRGRQEIHTVIQMYLGEANLKTMTCRLTVDWNQQ